MSTTEFARGYLPFDLDDVYADTYDCEPATVKDPIFPAETISVIIIPTEPSSELKVGEVRMRSRKARVRGIIEFAIISACMFGIVYCVYRFN